MTDASKNVQCEKCETELTNAGSIKTGERYEHESARGMGFGEPGALHTADRCDQVIAERSRTRIQIAVPDVAAIEAAGGRFIPNVRYSPK